MKNATCELYSYQDRKLLFKIFKNKCAYCGIDGISLTDDHFIPIAKGGLYSIKNIVPACLHCNLSKNDSHPILWFKNQDTYTKYRLKKILTILNITIEEIDRLLTN
jgi:5-methylcytosine-specific restriction endonuclease McrA